MKSTITLTFCDRAENHIGMQQIGELAKRGFKTKQLESFQERFGGEIYVLNTDEDLPDATVYVLRNGVNILSGVDPKELIVEQKKLTPDSKYYDRRRKKVSNKNARHNLCFADFEQQPNYEEGKGTIVSFSSQPLLNQLRTSLNEKLYSDGSLYAEGNYYYDLKKTGIGFHGDTERRIVIGVRLGDSIPLFYQWYHRNQVISPRYRIDLNHGDIYIMSDKAVGSDWKCSSRKTLRHAAGTSVKYVPENENTIQLEPKLGTSGSRLSRVCTAQINLVRIL